MPVTELHCTLLSDGSSDRALIPILRWLLHCHLPHCAIQLAWADLRQLPRPPRELHERIAASVELYPCDLLFVHRDAEGTSFQNRQTEVVCALGKAGVAPPGTPVIPVRMMEAWLLLDETAIRKAADNPNGQERLDLPKLGDIETISDPKRHLHDLVLDATGLPPQRRKRFSPYGAVHRIAEYVDDFSPLRRLSAFAHLEARLIATIREQGWCS